MSSHDTSLDEAKATLPQDRSAYYQGHLDRVSRSFALGIRQLEEPSRSLIGLSYLLFRLLDTIEDSPWASRQVQLKSFEMFEKFIEVEPERHEVRNWANAFSSNIPKGEQLLLKDAAILLADYHRLETTAHKIVRAGVLSMSRGMQHFVIATDNSEESSQRIKLKSVRETDQYCFFVAGIVGELLTKIVQIEVPFLLRERMLGDAFHFGLFLQKVNLLKDQREDATQGRFLVPDREMVRRSVDVHAWRALRYLQNLPLQLREYRLFCAWALYLGLASLPWIDRAWLDGSAGKMPRSQALPLLERLRKIISDNQALGIEAETYLRSANVLSFDSSLRPDLVIEPWFAVAYSGDLTKLELAGLGVLRPSTEIHRLETEGELAVNLERAIDMAELALLARQKSDGSWGGEVRLDPESEEDKTSRPSIKKNLLKNLARISGAIADLGGIKFPLKNDQKNLLGKAWNTIEQIAEVLTAEKQWPTERRQNPIWDTALSLQALPINSSASHRARQQGAEWLLDRQIRHVPTTEAVAMALQALDSQSVNAEAAETESIRTAIKGLQARQHKRGGWSSYPSTVSGFWPNMIEKLVTSNAPVADVSSLAIEALSAHRAQPGVNETLIRARGFLINERNERGLWRGESGVNYLYGTALACRALRALDNGVREEWALSPREFFMQTQRPDGGWGESTASYRAIDLAGQGAVESSVVQTSWALLGLCACHTGLSSELAAIRRAVNFLIERQNPNGEWLEKGYLSIFPATKVNFQNELHSINFPLLALTQARIVSSLAER